MSQFHEQDWTGRFAVLGDTAEKKFIEWCERHELPWVRFGLERPPISLRDVPARLRYAPDFMQSRRMVEVQGLGRDQLLKVKVDKFGALHHWNEIKTDRFDGVWFFVWDSHKKRECQFPLGMLDRLLNTGVAELAYFHEQKPYFAFPASEIFDWATTHEAAA